VGAAPLFASRNSNGDIGLYLLGSVEIADILDVLVEPGLATEFYASLLDALEVAGPREWKSLDLQNIPEASPTLSGLAAAASQRGWSHTQERLEVSPYVSLHESWETYLEGLESKQRRELKRKIRRAESYPSSVSWRISERAELDQDIDAFLALMGTDPAKAEFLTDDMREQFRQMVRTLGEKALIQLAMLYVGDELACAYLNLDFHGKLWVYNSSVNPEYFQLSPGWVLMGYIIQWAIEEGRTEVDFLRGSEDYKYRLGGVDREIFQLSITRET
jgi:CelD/BcsL family acetyltransferase involved in cellulose biosynthesis